MQEIELWISSQTKANWDAEVIGSEILISSFFIRKIWNFFLDKMKIGSWWRENATSVYATADELQRASRSSADYYLPVVSFDGQFLLYFTVKYVDVIMFVNWSIYIHIELLNYEKSICMILHCSSVSLVKIFCCLSFARIMTGNCTQAPFAYWHDIRLAKSLILYKVGVSFLKNQV